MNYADATCTFFRIASLQLLQPHASDGASNLEELTVQRKMTATIRVLKLMRSLADRSAIGAKSGVDFNRQQTP